MEVSELVMELARVGGRENLDTWLGETFGDDCVSKLLLVNSTVELDGDLCTYLDELNSRDEDSRFLRLSAVDRCGGPLWRITKYRCQLVKESESFYGCGSGQDQWLYTRLIQPQQQTPDVIEIRSNVVPRQVYRTMLEGMDASCPGNELCTEGFSVISELLREAGPKRHSCTQCCLAERLKNEAHIGAGLVRLWELTETDVNLVDARFQLGKGSDGTVNKIYWRKGVFARKDFEFYNANNCLTNPYFNMELEVAKAVSHPNIVRCFGSSSGFDYTKNCPLVSLYMEYLEGDLETRLSEQVQDSDPFSFQDILHILWQVADAMKKLHEKNFIHGDLKPGNILFSRLRMPHSTSVMFYLVKVADFSRAQRVPPEGFANPKSADCKSKAAVFVDCGTLKFTAPEVFSYRKDRNPPKHPQMIDVYSFGVVAFQMLTGKLALYEEYEYSPRELKAGVMSGKLRPDTADFDEKSLDRDRRSLLPYVRRCWDPNPEKRPPFSEICETLKMHSINRVKSGNLHSVGDVLKNLLKATIALCCSNRDSA